MMRFRVVDPQGNERGGGNPSPFATANLSTGLLAGGNLVAHDTLVTELVAGLTVGGDVGIRIPPHIDFTAGLLVGGGDGSHDTDHQFFATGIQVGGDLAVLDVNIVDLSTGILAGGDQATTTETTIDFSGGLLAGGDLAVLDVIIIDLTTGILAGGDLLSVDVDQEDLSSGILIGGDQTTTTQDEVDLGTGILLGGTMQGELPLGSLPVHYWAFDDDTGSTAADTGTSGSPITAVNVGGWTTSGLVFVSGGNVSAAISSGGASIQMAGTILDDVGTVFATARFSPLPATLRLLDFHSGSDHYRLSVDSTLTEQLVFENVSTTESVSATVPLADGVNFTWCLRYDGAAVDLFWNGAKVATDTFGFPIEHQQDYELDSNNLGSFATVVFDELRVYDGWIGDLDILALTAPVDFSGGLVAGGNILIGDIHLITPAGIASAEAFGTASLAVTIAPSGIASAEAFGTASLSITIAPSSIASAEAFGTASLAVTIAPSGIASAEALGTAAVAAAGIFTDNFTDTNATALTSHTPDSGGTWTVQSGTFYQISSNKFHRYNITSSNNPVPNYALINSTVHDNCTIEWNFTTPSATAWQTWLFFRTASAKGSWWAYNITSAGGTHSFLTRDGSNLNSGTASVATSTTYTCKVVLSGNSISCYFNGVLDITRSDGTYNDSSHNFVGIGDSWAQNASDCDYIKVY